MANKKDKRRQKQADHDATAFPSPPATPPATLPEPILTQEPCLPAAQNMSPKSIPLLICSIGNPGATFAHTLHSAGHTLFGAVWQIAQNSCDATSFVREKSWGGGLVSFPVTGRQLTWKGHQSGKALVDGATYLGSEGQEQMWTWWQSTSYMNVSGKGLAEARKRWQGALAAASYPPEMVENAKIVVLHDELEKPVGKYSIKKEKSSLKGHNGLKSIDASLRGQNFIRIGVGIDRPASRDPVDVSKHVLRKMTERERGTIINLAPAILDELRDIAEGK